MRPPAATRSIVCSMAATAPVASMTTGMPSPLVNFEHPLDKAGTAGDRRRAEIGGGRQPLRRNVGRINLGAARFRDLDHGKPDRAGAENEHGIVGRDLAAAAALDADRDGLGEGRLEIGEAVWHDVEVLRGRDDIVCETAFAVDPDDGEIGAAIALADAAGITLAAADEGIDDDPRADGGAGGAGTVCLDHA